VPEHKIGLEFDSYRYHGGRMKHDIDARRVLRLEAREWHMLRVTDEELDAGCPHALAALARLLHAAA
jgi:very-short-patch-repair endonuclease